MEFFAHYGATLLKGTLETLYMVFVSTAFAYLIGLPLGVVMVMTSQTASARIRRPTSFSARSSTSAAPSHSSF
jgi:ABC-type methionine transport system permease subunit